MFIQVYSTLWSNEVQPCSILARILKQLIPRPHQKKKTDRRPHKDVVLKNLKARGGWNNVSRHHRGFEDPDFPNGWILEEIWWTHLGHDWFPGTQSSISPPKNAQTSDLWHDMIKVCGYVFLTFCVFFFRDLFIAQTQSNQGVHCDGPAGPIALWWTLHKWHGTWYLYPYKWTPSPMWSNETVTNLK